MSYFVVATYYYDGHYGGPEEGGWWYTVRELADVVDADFDEDVAWVKAQRYNESIGAEQPRATVVELGRRELLPEYEEAACHSDVGELYDEETGELREEYSVVRWDVPVVTPEHRPHYC